MIQSILLRSNPTNDSTIHYLSISDKNDANHGYATVDVEGLACNVNDAEAHVLQMIEGNSKREPDRDFRNNRNDRGEFSHCVRIYPHKVGSVIGRGGSTIKELQSKFSVHIQVDRNENLEGKIGVNISGNRPDVERAADEVNKMTEDKIDSPVNSMPAPKQEEVFIDWQAAAKRCVRRILNVHSLQRNISVYILNFFAHS